MDKLNRIFAMQKELDSDIIALRKLESISSQEWIQKDVLAIVAELGELLNETSFKWWKNPKEINIAALQEEIVDVLHFFISLCIHAGLNADSLFELYAAKNIENFDRQHGRSDKPGYSAMDNEAGH